MSFAALENLRTGECPPSLTLASRSPSHTSLVTTDAADPVPLDLPSTAEARDLLAGRLGPHRVIAEPGARWTTSSPHCARRSLALAIVASRGASHLRFELRAIFVAGPASSRRS